MLMDQPALTTYNIELDLHLQKKLKWPGAQRSLSDEDFLDAVLDLNKELLPDSTDNRAEFLFYLLVQAGRRRPGLFPVPDLCLAAFNILAARHNLAESRLVCLDLGLLPTAVLASGLGAKVAPPLSSGPKYWPDHFWPTVRTDDRNTKGALILGRDPVKLTESNPDILEDLAKAEGGIVFCFWDFLGVNLHSHMRLKWLHLIRTLIQFPRPTRQGVIYYPALIETAPAQWQNLKDPPDIRLADVRESAPGPGGLSQAEVLRAALDQADGEKSLDLSPGQLAGREDADFTPRRLLAGPKGTGEVPLADRARLIRCQLPRLKPALNEDDRSYICREINLSHLDDVAGFVKPGAGQKIRFGYFDPQGREGQYLLQRHDILMCFRGTEATIGRVGLVTHQPEEPLISGQSLCVIRAFRDFDPIWLYYYLRREDVRRRVLSRSSGSNMLTVNLGELRELAIAQPGPTQSAVVAEKHQNLLSLVDEIRQLYDRAGMELKALNSSVT